MLPLLPGVIWAFNWENKDTLEKVLKYRSRLSWTWDTYRKEIALIPSSNLLWYFICFNRKTTLSPKSSRYDSCLFFKTQTEECTKYCWIPYLVCHEAIFNAENVEENTVKCRKWKKSNHQRQKKLKQEHWVRACSRHWCRPSGRSPLSISSLIQNTKLDEF